MKTITRFFIYEPKSKLFAVERKNLSVDKGHGSISGELICCSDIQNAISTASKKEADDLLKVIINGCGYATLNDVKFRIALIEKTNSLQKFLGCKVDNSALEIIINPNRFIVQEFEISYSMKDVK